jgi:hypothetical protein
MPERAFLLATAFTSADVVKSWGLCGHLAASVNRIFVIPELTANPDIKLN